ncbi:MAG: hypothetical protein JW795_17785 [Chitinivibrionales bacterium]|nr:hypothetical protein [Chitinivibrionales bacterium]
MAPGKSFFLLSVRQAAAIFLTAAMELCCQSQDRHDTASVRLWGSMTADGVCLYTPFSQKVADDYAIYGVSTLTLGLSTQGRNLGAIEVLADCSVRSTASAEKSESTHTAAMSFFNLRKLFLTLNLAQVDLAIGRQIINFGHGVMFSPLDVFSTVDLNDINFSRRGSDVASLRLPLGALSGCDFFAGVPSTDNSYSIAGRFFTTLIDFDLSIVSIYHGTATDNSQDSDRLLGGFSFKGDCVAGVYGECVATYNRYGIDHLFQAMFGADYSLSNTWFFQIEWLFNDTLSHTDFTRRTDQAAFCSIRSALNDLMDCAASLRRDISGRSIIGTGSFRYNILQNSDLWLFVQGLRRSGITTLLYMARIGVSF